MRQSKHSAIPVFVALVAIVASTGLVGVLSESSSNYAESAGITSTQDVIDIELDQLSVSLSRTARFSADQLPQAVRSLQNKRIRIRGYMHPTFEETGITEFTLNGETRSRGYNWGAELRHIPLHYYIDVFLQDGRTVDYGHKPFIVEGVLGISPEIQNGQLITIFRIEDATLKSTKPRDGYHAAVWAGC